MTNTARASLSYRSLLTDTLPYEVPVIFSNDRFHAALATTFANVPKDLRHFIDKDSKFTIPYNYEISANSRKTRTLSIPHPLSQRLAADFLELNANAILAHCERSQFSLRKPVALASPFSADVDHDQDREKSGIPQLLQEAGQPDPSHMMSFFVYGKYNLLGKFISSREFIRLEMRYPLMRQMDVSKCFYNIYTHSITWAVKDKLFAKMQKETYAFESSFDKLMQRCNYNETNGIIVGPELSRIFAEIILQDIDQAIEAKLDADFDIKARHHYDIRRYVDDYFVFAASPEHLDKIESVISSQLEKYKLYLNEKKIVTAHRPYVSKLTLARDEVRSKLSEITSLLAVTENDAKLEDLRRITRTLAKHLRSIRLIVAKHEVDFSNISGWLMSRLRRIIKRAARIAAEKADESLKEALAELAISALDTALYTCSLDLRVRTTYSLCQIALVFQKSADAFGAEQSDLISHMICDHLVGLIKFRSAARPSGATDDVELYNLLICGAHFIGSDFLSSPAIIATLEYLADTPKITYFRYITLMFCFRRDRSKFASHSLKLNMDVYSWLQSNFKNIGTDTETFMLALDFLSCPEAPQINKKLLFQSITGESNPPKIARVKLVARHLSFTDWTGVTVEHQLKRTELRPVYEWG